MKVLFEKSKAKNARVQMSEAFITSVFLALSGGFQDAYTYFTRDEVFSNAQTGNVVLMSQHFMLGEWQRGLHYLIPLLAFAGGVFFADCVQGKFKYANRLHWRQGILLLEILILFGVGFIPQDYKYACDNISVVLLCDAGAVIPQSWRIFLCEYDVYRKLKKRHGSVVSIHEGQTPGADSAGDVLFWDYPVFCSGSRNRWKSVYAAWI